MTTSHTSTKSEIIIISLMCRWYVFQNLVTDDENNNHAYGKEILPRDVLILLAKLLE